MKVKYLEDGQSSTPSEETAVSSEEPNTGSPAPGD